MIKILVLIFYQRIKQIFYKSLLIKLLFRINEKKIYLFNKFIKLNF